MLGGEQNGEAMGVVLMDDLCLVRQALGALLAKEPDFQVLAEADNGIQAVKMVSNLAPQVVIMGISALEPMVLTLIKELAATSPGVKILAWSTVISRHFVMEAFRAGATGYLLRDCRLAEMLAALHQVSQEQLYLSRAISDGDVDRLLAGLPPKSQGATLTVRELEVLHLLTEGKSRRQIADRLKVNPKTVESHTLNLKNKLGLSSQAELTKYALREGLTSLDS